MVKVAYEAFARGPDRHMDSATDVYTRAPGGGFDLMSLGGTAELSALFRGASADGTRVLFTTAEPLVSTDDDTAVDLYANNNLSGPFHISGGAINGDGAFNVTFAGSSTDASRVFFTSSEKLTSADTDTRADIYEAAGSTTLISAGQINGNGAFTPTFRAVSSDGTRVFFTTTEPLATVDTDASLDIYQRFGGVTSRVSGGSSGANGAFTPTFEGIKPNGSVAYFTTQEAISTADTDTAIDLYGRTSGGSIQSVSAQWGDASFDARFGGASSGRVFFRTQEALEVAGDEDDATDVFGYDGSLTRVSTGVSDAFPGQGGFAAAFAGATPDGTTALFTTYEQLSPADRDTFRDIYAVTAPGLTTLVSTDSKPPETTITGGVPDAGATRDSTPVFEFGSSESDSSFTCRVDAASFAPCANPKVLGPLTEGSHTLDVVATDVNGNADPTPATRTFTVDTIDPDISIDNAPRFTSDSTPRFDFSSTEPVFFTCRLGAAVSTCSPSFPVTSSQFTVGTPLADGSYVFRLRGRDPAGNTSHVHHAFTVDTVAPETTLDAVDVTGSRATVYFSGSDASADASPLRFQCSLDSAPFTSCASPRVFNGLAAGPHTVAVRAVDAAGNVDQTAASQGFSV